MMFKEHPFLSSSYNQCGDHQPQRKQLTCLSQDLGTTSKVPNFLSAVFLSRIYFYIILI